MLNAEVLVRQPGVLPAMPRVVQSLIASLADDEVPIRSIGIQLASDPVLTAKVLRVANSPYYRSARHVESVEEAIRILGINSVRTLVMSAGLVSTFQPTPDFDMRRFWQHSVQTAAGAKALAKYIHCDAEIAFTLGLMHGIGRLVMLSSMRDKLEPLDMVIGALPSPDRHNVEREAFGFSFADVGAELAKQWQFPEIYVRGMVQCMEPAADEADAELFAAVDLAGWISRGEIDSLNRDVMSALWPYDVALIAGLDREEVLTEFPVLKELAAGLEALIA